MRHATAQARGSSEPELPIELTFGPIGAASQLSGPKQIWPGRPANLGFATLAQTSRQPTQRLARATRRPQRPRRHATAPRRPTGDDDEAREPASSPEKAPRSGLETAARATRRLTTTKQPTNSADNRAGPATWPPHDDAAGQRRRGRPPDASAVEEQVPWRKRNGEMKEEPELVNE